MAWNQRNEQAQQTQNTERKPELFAVIDDATKEAAKSNEYIDTASKALLEAAKQIVADMKEAGIQTSARKKDGGTYIPPLRVKVEQAVRWDKETKEEVPQTHKDGTPKYEPSIEIKDANATIKLIAAEDVSKGAKLIGGIGAAWDNQQKHTVRAGLHAIENNASFWKHPKEIAAFVIDKGYVQENPLREFAYEANQHFDATIIKEDGQEVKDTWAKYDRDFDKVVIRSHSTDANIELNIGSGDYEGRAFATLVEFNGAGNAPTRTPIASPQELASLADAGKVTEEVANAVAQFKGWNDPVRQMAVDLNAFFKESGSVALNKDGNPVQNSYAKVNEQGDAIQIRNHDNNIVVEFSEYKDKPVVRAIDFDQKRDDGRYETVTIRSAADMEQYLGGMPEEILSAIATYKNFDAPEQEQSKGKKSPEVER